MKKRLIGDDVRILVASLPSRVSLPYEFLSHLNSLAATTNPATHPSCFPLLTGLAFFFVSDAVP
jgi:hypothetical protein